MVWFFKNNDTAEGEAETPPNDPMYLRLVARLQSSYRSIISKEITEIVKDVEVPQSKVDELCKKLLDSIYRQIGIDGEKDEFAYVQTLVRALWMWSCTGCSLVFAYHLLEVILEFIGIKSAARLVLAGLVVHVVRKISDSFDRTPTSVRMKAESGDWIDDTTSVLTALWQTISVATGCIGEKPDGLRDWATTAFNQVNKHSSKTRGLLNFFQVVVKSVGWMYSWVGTKVFGVSNLDQMVIRNETFLKKWIDESNFLLQPKNRDIILRSHRWTARLNQATRIGELLQRELASEKGGPIVTVTKILDRLHTLRDSSFNLGAATSVRMEPVCVWVYGAAGLGKTHMSDTLISEFLEMIDYKEPGNPIYTHTPGTKHWTGVGDSPVIKMDDYGLTATPALGEDTETFCRLVSAARFTPDQAAVEDKGRPITAKLVYVNSNESHPTPNELVQREAFWRRRNIVIGIFKVKDFLFTNMEQPGAKDWVEANLQEQIAKYGHVKNPYPQAYFMGVSNMDAGKSETAPMSYATMLKWYKQQAMAAYLKKIKVFEDAKTNLLRFEPTDLNMPYEHIMKAIAEHSATVAVDPNTGDSEYRQEKRERWDAIVNKLTELYDTSMAVPREAKQRITEQVQAFFGNTSTTTMRAEMADSETDEDNPPEGSVNTLLARRKRKPQRLQQFRATLRGGILPPASEEPPTTSVAEENDILAPPFETASDASEPSTPSCRCTVLSIRKYCLDNDKILDATTYAPATVACGANCDFIISDSIYVQAFNMFTTDYHSRLIAAIHQKYRVQIGGGPITPIYVPVEWASFYKELSRKDHLNTRFFAVLMILVIIEFIIIIVLPFFHGLIGKLFDRTSSKEENHTQYIELPDRTDQRSSAEMFVKQALPQVINSVPLAESMTVGATRMPKSRTGIKPKAVKSDTPKAQMVAEMDILPIEPCLRRNMFTLFANGVENGSPRRTAARGFGVTGRWGLVLKHYLLKIERFEDPHVVFISDQADDKHIIRWDQLIRREIVESEYVAVRFPKQVPQFRNSMHWFMTSEESARVPREMWAYEKALGVEARHVKLSGRIAKPMGWEFDGTYFEVPEAIEYDWHGPGRCGTPIYAKIGEWRIIGFHFCGGSGKGAAEPIVRETLAFMTGDMQAESAPDEYISNSAEPIFELEGTLLEEGIANSTYSARPANKTSFVPSLVHGYVEPTTRPAPLHPTHVGGAFSPLQEGCNIHGNPPEDFDENLADIAESWLQEDYDMLCTPVRMQVGVLSVAEAVCGFPGMPGYNSMELGTSEGFPYTATRPKGQHDKRYLFTFEETDDGRELIEIDDQLMQALVRKETQRLQGIVPFTVFMDCLKDGRLVLAKYMRPGATRIFSISPCDYTIAFRQYYLDILAAQQVNRDKLEHRVGMNVHSLEWTKLGRHIQSKGPAVICGDYKQFGPRLNAEIVRRVGRVWRNWYLTHGDMDSDHYRIREIMFEELRFSVHLCGNIFYRVVCGAPSGAPPTVNVNNDVNKMYIYMAWLDCWKSNPLLRTHVAFKKHCALVVYGDDLVLNVSNDVVEVFNNEFLQGFFGRHKIVYTDERKGTEIRKYGTFSEATFLKGKWRKNEDHPGCFDYQLEAPVVRETANWIDNSQDAIEATRTNVHQSLMLAFGHGREFFDSHRAELFKAWRKHCSGEELTLYTYDEMSHIRYSVDFEDSADLDQLIEREKDLRSRQKQCDQLAVGLTNLMEE